MYSSYLPLCNFAYFLSLIIFINRAFIKLFLAHSFKNKEEFDDVQDFCLEVGLPVTLEECGVTTEEEMRKIAEAACAPGETIHNLAGDVQPIELYDAMKQADAMGRIVLGK